MPNLIKDPNPPTTPGDGSTINTDCYNEICDRLGLARPTANRVIITDINGFYVVSTITDTKLGYLGDVTGDIQAQLSGKAASIHAHVISDITDLQAQLDAIAADADAHIIAETTGLQTALDGKLALGLAELLANKGAVSGYAGLNALQQLTNNLAAASQVPDLDAAKITSGQFAMARIASGTPDGTKFVRDDGTLQTPPGSSSPITRIAGSSGAAGADITFQRLTADSSSITSTTPSVVMTTTGVGAGTWHFKYIVIYQTVATGTGIGLSVNHSGTVGQFASHLKQANSIATASNGIGEDIVTAQAGMIYEARPESAKDTVSFKTAGVGNANTDIMAVLEGIIVVTATGQLELKLSTEVDTSGVKLMADSMLILEKIG